MAVKKTRKLFGFMSYSHLKDDAFAAVKTNAGF